MNAEKATDIECFKDGSKPRRSPTRKCSVSDMVERLA
jgi:hypothetical protein